MWKLFLEIYNFSNHNIEYTDNLDTHYIVDDITRGTTFVLSNDNDIMEKHPESSLYRMGEVVPNDIIYKVLPSIDYNAVLRWYSKEHEQFFCEGSISINSSGLLIHRGDLDQQGFKMTVITKDHNHMQKTNDAKFVLSHSELQNLESVYIRFENN